MDLFPRRLVQELEHLILLNPDISNDFNAVEDILEHAKPIIGITRVPTHDHEDILGTIQALLHKLRSRELISLYLRLCEDGILLIDEVNDILSQIRQEFIRYGEGLVWVDHGIQELKEGIKEAVDILEALDFENTKNELQEAAKDLTRGAWDSAVWRSSKAIEGVCKEVARRYKDKHGGTIEQWRGMNDVQINLINLGYWSNNEPLKELVDYLRNSLRNPTVHFDEDQTDIAANKISTNESAYMAFQIAHLIALSMLRRL